MTASFRARSWAGIAVLAACLTLDVNAQDAPRPNIVLIYADDLGYGDISAQGATAIRTPNIDRLAEEGLRFTDAHSPASTCTPSRFSMLTGAYAWRTPGSGIASGVDPLLIRPGTVTLPGVLRHAGYATAVVGKWHLGLGTDRTDYNAPRIEPGPLEIGFDTFFGLPATGDRVPCVYIEDHGVFNYDPADPLLVNYGSRVGDEPTAATNPELLRYPPSRGHSGTIINGISRIGYMDGGVAARWIDEDMTFALTDRARAFIDENAARPFFLFLSAHDVHVPRLPHADFLGTSDHGLRGDAIHQLDWMVGAVLDKLDERELADDTLVIFTSDNGPVLDDGYADGSRANPGGHDINGPFRGGKYSLYEGGHRVPFLARWPGRIPIGVSSALISQTDLLATFAALAGQPLPTDAAPDSVDVAAELLGDSTAGRGTFVNQNNNATPLALRRGRWKYTTNRALYDLVSDPGETRNVAAANPEIISDMAARLAEIRATPAVSSLVAWWPLDDGRGDEAADLSLNANTGTLVNAPEWAQEEGGTFLRFDGVDQTVRVDGAPSLPNDITVACWARGAATTWNAAATLVAGRSQFSLYAVDGTTRVGIRVFDAAGTPHAAEVDLATIAGVAIADWHHYAASYDASRGEIALYVDGVERAAETIDSGVLRAGDGPLCLGSENLRAGSFFAGDLSDARIYDQILAPQRIANMASARLLDGDGDAMLDDWEMRFGLDPFSADDASEDPDGDSIDNRTEFERRTSPIIPDRTTPGALVAHWSLDDGAGTSATDSSGNEHVGVLAGGPAWRSEEGRDYLQFDGVDDHVVVEGLPDLNAQVTVGCWARSDTPVWNIAGTLMSRRPQWVLHPWRDSTRFSFIVFRPGGSQVSTEIDLATLPEFDLTEWHHYAASYDANSGTTRVYVDGTLRAVQSIGPTLLQSNSDELHLGRDVGRSRYLDGAIDEAYVFDYVLTADEIRGLMSGDLTAGGFQVPGDCDQSGRIDISDMVCLLRALFGVGPGSDPIPWPCSGDSGGPLQGRGPNESGDIALLNWNGDDAVDISDALYGLQYLFGGFEGTPHALSNACRRIAECPDVCTP